MLTLSYSDLITDRGFKYVFQTSATAGSQARQALPQIVKLAEAASGKRPKTVAIVTDNTAASVSSAKAMRDGLLAENGLQLIGRRNLYAAARRRHLAGAEGALGASRTCCSSCRP